MRKYTYILFLLLSQFLFSQDYKVIQDIPEHINSKTIINNYFKAIGGEKQINKIQTLQKKFKIKIEGTANIDMEGEVLYKTPNLYSSILKINQLGQIQSTKYDGVNCLVERYHNDKIIEKNLEGKLLKEKMKDFYPFPILEEKKKNSKFIIKEIHQSKNNKRYKIQIENNNSKEVISLYFDANTNYLVMKEMINEDRIKTIEYEKYTEVDKIMFPFIEISTIQINNQIAQKSINTINEIIINKEILINKFQ